VVRDSNQASPKYEEMLITTLLWSVIIYYKVDGDNTEADIRVTSELHFISRNNDIFSCTFLLFF
jgi:hypothetical protein